MSATAVSTSFATPAARIRVNLRAMLATARAYLLRFASNPIQLIRAPLSPILIVGGFVLAYNISGQTVVPDDQVIGFLIVGVFMTGCWSSTVWGAGFALQAERYFGTIGAVISAPASTVSVITGYTLGSLAIGMADAVATVIVGLAVGGRFVIHDPLALILSVLAIYLSTICIGLAFAGLFILSRNANSLSNVLQTPIYILCGFYVPRSVLPEWAQWIGACIPLTHAADALRGASLTGNSLGEIARPLLLTLGTALVFLVVGLWALGKADRSARRSGTLDLL
ncbi:MAG: ABC transporter permease [Thermomicrobiales bacterium]